MIAANQFDPNLVMTGYIPTPYCPPLAEDKQDWFTLVVDLDETLVHYNPNLEQVKRLAIRPGAMEFLEELAKYYEIMIFTAAIQEYADEILNKLDPEGNLISYRLYRQHTSLSNNTYVKDISRIGRDMKRIIIIDNVWENFQCQPENGIFIKTWKSDVNDRDLIDLMVVVKALAVAKVSDVRKALRKFRDEMINLTLRGVERPIEAIKNML